MSGALRKFREATQHRGGLFFVVVWGVLFFGGLTFAMDVFIKVFSQHQHLDDKSLVGIASENLLGGILWGSAMWFIFVRRSPQECDEALCLRG